MVLVALLLVVAAVLFAVAVVTNGSAPATLDVELFKVHTTVAGVFASGLASVVVLAVAWWLMKAGWRHGRRQRAEVKRLRSAAADSARRSPAGTSESERGIDQHLDSAPRDES